MGVHIAASSLPSRAPPREHRVRATTSLPSDAQNAIRHKSQALSYLQLSSRIDAVAARLDTAIRTNQISSAMQSIVGGMHHALKSMDVEKVGSARRAKTTREASDADAEHGRTDRLDNGFVRAEF